ncbi:5-hydroxytryptamine receptor 3E-like isoform X2 [Synchiropus splendidus]|uniref:5-hydroxytryptamine receptor 3E-like isoform X2 n=1 Tax=Synchiropus splendidus TaxID=270530 RepID=UPI00237E3372|nr:5-hydroxytryptamine receptor 3E-like isoform X2 [Synchiropus splendidus]
MSERASPKKWLPPGWAALLVAATILVPCGALVKNCSAPDQPALLKALNPVFNLSAIRPVWNMSTCTNVSVYFTLYGILGVDEKAQILKTYIWLHYWWKNEFVSWDPEECGASNISLPKAKFWVPDIVINEFMDENSAPEVPYLYLHSNGAIHDSQPVRVVSSCNLNIYTFPFDIQKCTLTFNSYIHLAMDIKILLGRAEEEITKRSKNVMTTMGEWELLDITADQGEATTDSSTIDELIFYIRVRRRAMLYVVNLLIPSCFLITVDLFSFLLPPQSVDRSSFKMTLILGYTVFLLIMNDLLPITGNTIPLIKSPPKTFTNKHMLDNRFPEKKGDAEQEDKALEELKNLSRDLQAIRVQVDRQINGTKSSEDWTKRHMPRVKSTKLLFLFVSVLMHGSCSCVMLNCSRPDPPALLEALKPVFNLSSIRPVVNSSTPTFVYVNILITSILGVDEKAQLLKTYMVQNFQWKNEFVHWDPDHCGSHWLTLTRKLLWVPDIVINEFMEENKVPFVPYTYLYHDGFVNDFQPFRVISSCRLDTYMFPFDIQNCTLTFNSYLHPVSSIELGTRVLAEDVYKASKARMSSAGEWELIGIEHSLHRLPTSNGDFYEELRFHVSIRRRSTMYVVNLLLPSCFLIAVDLFSFMLPPDCVDRSLFKMTLILGYTVFLLNMNSQLPATGDTIPLLNVFLSLCLTLMMGSLLETIVITNFLHGSSRLPALPRWIKVLVIKVLGCVVGLPRKPKAKDTVVENPAGLEMPVSVPYDEEASIDMMVKRLQILSRELHILRLQVDQHLGRSQTAEEWIQVSLIVDRLLFIIYIFFLSISLTTFVVLWATSQNI